VCVNGCVSFLLVLACLSLAADAAVSALAGAASVMAVAPSALGLGPSSSVENRNACSVPPWVAKGKIRTLLLASEMPVPILP
jgi:hypothetical protein